MAIQFELYKSPNPKDEEDKELYHARVVNFQHIDTDYLAKEIQQATSLTEGDVKAVLESLSHFMGSRLREGERVHLDGIGYFQVKLNSLEPITSPKLKANQMKLKANIGFKADKKLRSSVSVVKVERSKLKLHSVPRSNEEIDRLLTAYFSNNQILTRSDFQGLCKLTLTTAARHIKRLKEEKKRLKAEQKAQKKEAKRRARELDDQEEELEESSGGSGPVVIVTFIIVVIWIAILALLIKLDVGGFGSTVLRPILQNVPVVNKVLPEEKMTVPGSGGEEEEYYGYTNLKDAVDQIRRLELELENAQSGNAGTESRIQELEAEIDRLRTFEDNQVAFENIKNEFYNEVIYSDKGPGADAYIKYYEAMDPATAENLYKQVVAQQQVDSKVQDYANAYAEMKPAAAAAIFESMQDDLDLAAKILNTMGVDDRGKILGAMDAEVAARLTKIMDPDA